MLQLILGPARSGKTSCVRQKIAAAAALPQSRIFLLVPEQFTYETEKILYQELGGERYKRVNVTSFTRLATEVFRTYGGIAGRYADDCAKGILMDNALSELSDQLEVYGKSLRAKGFSETMLETVAELKNAGVDPDTLKNCAQRLEPGLLRDKVKETALIYQTYQTLLERAYLDPLDNITRAEKLLRSTSYFDGSLVFFDEFKGFTANENGLIRLILSRAKEVCFTLCLDWQRACEHSSGVFASTLEVYHKLLRFARQAGCAVAPPVHLERSFFDAPELFHLEQSLFSPVISPFLEENRSIRAVLCKNEYDEVDYALSYLAGLVQEEGYHYNDIAILTRDMDTYRPRLEAGFRKYRIPYYSDALTGILHKPLIRFVQNALDCAVRGFSDENVLAMLKCGVTPFTVEETAELENYVYVWGITGRQWTAPFTANPRGYQEQFTPEDGAALERLNRLREFFILPLVRFRERIGNAGGREICAALFDLLEELRVRETLQQQIEAIYKEENFALAQEYARIWDMLMELLDTLAVTTSEGVRPGDLEDVPERIQLEAARFPAESGGAPIRPERFLRLFWLAASGCQIGALPQALDAVLAGSADRVRLNGKRAVIVLGVNENVLPFVPAESGVFTDRERTLLADAEIELAGSSKDRLKEERFIAYKTLTAPAKRLLLTARKGDISGGKLSPSGIFAELSKMFGPEVLLDADDGDELFYCKSGDAAFARLAGIYLDDTPLTASLKTVLGERPEYRRRLAGLDRVLGRREFALQNRETAAGLFGRDLRLSPTRIENFYRCRFRYFLEQGLSVYPLRRAQLDPLETGTLIHQVLYAAASRLDLKGEWDGALAKRIIKEELDRYIETVMGGVKDKTSRFLYLYNRMRLSILKIVEQLHRELSQSEFCPCDFEYAIESGAEITPLRLMGEDGASIYVAGKIDRIDSYTSKSGEKYIRIVDYKSGRKQFRLNDVLYGLNLQMLIYLHCITKNGRGRYENCLPAGILYMPAGEQPPSLDRRADAEETARQKIKSYTMNGLLLEDREVLQAMDASMAGLFIPVSLKKDGEFTAASKNSLVTLSELGKINSYIDRLVVNMARELHDGRIEALPLEDSCGYCPYRGVCGVTKASRVREYCAFDRDAALAEMEKALDG